jgi:hypothetical protein
MWLALSGQGELSEASATGAGAGRAGGRVGRPFEAAMSLLSSSRRLTIWLWVAVSLSLLAWMTAGYPKLVCIIAVLPLLAPLNGLIRGKRYTYAWATLFAIPYLDVLRHGAAGKPRRRAGWPPSACCWCSAGSAL